MKSSAKFLYMVLIPAIVIGVLACNSSAPQGGKTSFGNISADEANIMIRNNIDNDQFIILDTRTTGEYNQGHLANSIFLDFSASDFYTRVSELDKNKTYLVYCRSGRRSGNTMDYMKKNGFKKAWNMDGGINAWQKAGFKLIR